jgi:hypothetical protein
MIEVIGRDETCLSELQMAVGDLRCRGRVRVLRAEVDSVTQRYRNAALSDKNTPIADK